MRPWFAVLLGACCALVIACAAGSRSPQSAAGATPGAMVNDGASPRAERAEIDQLDREIDDELAKLGLPPASAPACAAASCGATAPQPMSVPSSTGDAACHPSKSDTCADSCKLSDSICSNADKICALAKQLGGNDGYANEKCAKGETSCKASHEKCCGCQL